MAGQFRIVHRWYELVDRKSTRLNSSHGYISYAVFCLKKKKKRKKKEEKMKIDARELMRIGIHEIRQQHDELHQITDEQEDVQSREFEIDTHKLCLRRE